MRLPPLIEGRLILRYKRFLADVELAGGRRITAFVPNTGSLLGCIEPGRPVWLADSANSTRKHRYTWMLVKPERSLVCVDTFVANPVVFDAARRQQIPQLAGYREYLAEVPYGQNSRADLCCRVHADDMLRRVWVEVKSTTLAENGVAMFPDAVTERGRKHLVELQSMVRRGERALQLFFVQRRDAEVFRPAGHIDPAYAGELRRAAANGVKVLALQAKITKRSITILRPLRVEI